MCLNLQHGDRLIPPENWGALLLGETRGVCVGKAGRHSLLSVEFGVCQGSLGLRRIELQETRQCDPHQTLTGFSPVSAERFAHACVRQLQHIYARHAGSDRWDDDCSSWYEPNVDEIVELVRYERTLGRSHGSFLAGALPELTDAQFVFLSPAKF